MTQSLPSEQTNTENNNFTNIFEKNFLDLSTTEMEELMKEGVKQAKKRMHDKGISSASSVNGEIYEEFPDGSRKLRH